MRDDIRKITPQNENSFYDPFSKMSYKAQRAYNILTGIRTVKFNKYK